MKKRINTNFHTVHFILKRNKYFPNSRRPVLLYQKGIELPSQKNKAVQIIQKIFAGNGWSNSWRNGIYDFHHYHSTTHECMGIAMGFANIILGGPKGKKIKLVQGDVLIIPAGVAHKCINYSKDFLCVGAYPQGKNYDINLGRNKELEKALANIRKISLPAKDPLLGQEGFLKTYWKK